MSRKRSGAGRILIGTSVIWPFHPEKCLCVGEAWAEANPDLLHHLLRAVLQAQVRCDQPEEAAGIAALLADPNGLRIAGGSLPSGAAGRVGGGVDPVPHQGSLVSGARSRGVVPWTDAALGMAR